MDIDDDSVHVYVKWGVQMLTLSKDISDANRLQAVPNGTLNFIIITAGYRQERIPWCRLFKLLFVPK